MRSIPWLLAASSARPKLGPFPPRALPRFVGTTNLSATPRRPGLSLAGVRLRGLPLTAGASRVATALLVPTCRRHYPGGTAGGIESFPGTCDSGLPHPFAGSAPTLPVSRPVRRSLALRPACSRNRLCGPLHRRLRQFRYLHYRSDCYRLERQLPGGNYTH